jgi:tetratricopeptide (TPR) repeat protein
VESSYIFNSYLYSYILGRTGKPEEVVESAREALKRIEGTFGPADPRAIVAEVDLGTAMRAAGDLKGAREIHATALAAARKRLGEDHAATVVAARELGLTMLASSRLIEAIRLLDTVRDRVEINSGPQSPESAAANENLAFAARASGDLRWARDLQEHAVDLWRTVLGAGAVPTLAAEANLASVLGAAGEVKIATKHFRRLAFEQRQTLGPDHPAAIAAQARLGDAYLQLGDVDGARGELTEAVGRLEAGGEPAATVTSVKALLAVTLAASLHKREQAEGLELARFVTEQRREELGSYHPLTLYALHVYAGLARGHDEELAIATASEAAEKSATALGRGHIDTLRTYEGLAETLRAYGDEAGADEVRRENLALRAADSGIVSDGTPPIENLAGILSAPGSVVEGDFAQLPAIASLAGGVAEPVSRTGHVELEPPGEIAPGDRFEVVVYVDCTAIEGAAGQAELTFVPPPDIDRLELRVWLVVTRHFEIEGDPVRPLELELAVESTPRLRFGVFARHPAEHYPEEPEVRVVFSYNGWPSGQVALPVPLAGTAQETPA